MTDTVAEVLLRMKRARFKALAKLERDKQSTPVDRREMHLLSHEMDELKKIVAER